MLGAILGDMIGSPYEFDRGERTTSFPLFTRKSSLNDDTVMSVAIAETLLKASKEARRNQKRMYKKHAKIRKKISKCRLWC